MLENLRVSDIVVHEVFQRGQDRRIPQPEFGTHLELLSPEAMTAFRLRITDALSAKSKAIEMRIVKTGSGSFHADAEALVACATSEDFLLLSQSIPTRLSEAQTSQLIPGGIVIVFRGVTGGENLPFVGAIKADVQAGFRRRRDGTSIITEFVNDLFLTQATRLYKIGFMVAPSTRQGEAAGWRAIVFDHKIVPSNREAAAIYFYESFLGCGFMEDSAYETARFFNLTQEFAKSRIADRETRHAVQDALYTYVKNDQAPTFTVEEFADRHVPIDNRDNYREFMVSKQFPERAVRRDTAELTTRLRRRKFKYGTDIELSASPEALADGRVTIETVPQVGGAGGIDRTVITISDPFVKES